MSHITMERGLMAFERELYEWQSLSPMLTAVFSMLIKVLVVVLDGVWVRNKTQNSKLQVRLCSSPVMQTINGGNH